MIPNLTSIKESSPPRFRCTVPCVGWSREPDHYGMQVYSHASGLLVLASNDTMDDGTEYLHVSVSRKDRLPDWNELKLVKEQFIGRNEEAVHVLPRERDYVNLHKFCLHLWSPT